MATGHCPYLFNLDFWPSKDKPATLKQPPASCKLLISNNTLADPASLWVVVKQRNETLSPANYVPANLVVTSVLLRVPDSESMQLRADTAAALKTMFAAAGRFAGVPLCSRAAIGHYDYQVIYTMAMLWMKVGGQADKVDCPARFLASTKLV